MKDRIRSSWSTAILVCRKCEKRVGAGFGPEGDQSLSKALRRRAGGKGRKAAFGVVATGCLEVCPKHAVTVVNARRAGEWLIIRRGTPLAAVEAALALDQPA